MADPAPFPLPGDFPNGFDFYQHIPGKLLDRHCGTGGFAGKALCVNFVKRRKIFHISEKTGGFNHLVQNPIGSGQALGKTGKSPIFPPNPGKLLQNLKLWNSLY
jgi:hypothetical protein